VWFILKKIKIAQLQMLQKVDENGLMLTLDNVSSVDGIGKFAFHSVE
jgi:hypothetical protein